ncbi:hypothetical protein [Pseudomonas sp. Irchel s3h14]|uniref:hypothetical protein n=1 Tax=Pseudomonas sp. Irchel s3h14 TaxID=2009179 RepID=UPI000BA351DA|nr:hypothetical protein [Pseudomonas sp. Irchel s3h14]
MELGYIIKIIVALGTMAGAAKVVYELSVGGKLRLREEYRFAKEFLKDLETTPKLHHLAEERGYYALAGTSSMKASEIKYLVSLRDADRRLKDYVLARRYVVLKEGTNKIGFRDKYRSVWSRTWRKVIHIITYMIGSFLSFSPLLVIQPFGLPPKYMLLVFITLPCFGFFAVDFMRSFVKISRGEVLVKEQQEHAPRIYVEKEHRKTAGTVT